ncbi:phosphoglycolate phosphatase [Alteromonas gilva]|uniref:Phosphoglycolate phosphatase n=1 Tax=Alteromonas gilva TaxID=2987522 RepID=A0ABT5L674_9ALTE|nr:phosphoglycolate phosphatase [Alteromonas gilva]MDC8832378.1 phosphoglycolate phosphatase [Alteromonas gilva]
MKNIQVSHILFDLDGTLIDSVPDLAYCVDIAMREAGLPARGELAVRNWVGNGIEKLVARAVSNSEHGNAEQPLFDVAFSAFLAAYTANNGKYSKLYDGVLSTLDWLIDNGYRLACVTNKASAFTLPLLHQKGLARYFDVVVSGDTCGHKKPHPEPLNYALRALQTSADKAIMVGDSRADIHAARAAGCPVYALTYGYNHGEDISIYQPDKILQSLVELPAILGAGQ